MSNSNREIFAKRLVQARLNTGLIRSEAAEAIGILATRYTNFEHGLRLPDIALIDRIAQVYKVNPAWLVGWTNDIRPPRNRKKADQNK